MIQAIAVKAIAYLALKPPETYLTESITLQYGLSAGELKQTVCMVSVMDSMQVTKETSHMHEQCVPGAPSDFSSTWERGYI